MNPSDLQKVAAKLPLSASVIARNAEALGDSLILKDSAGTPTTEVFMQPPKRIRQSAKPLLNKLESDYRDHLKVRYPQMTIHPQAMRLKLANGAWYKPDLCGWFNAWEDGSTGVLTCWECKGPKEAKNVARGILTIKFAAEAWPEISFYLVWRDQRGQFQEQRVLPSERLTP